MNPIKGILGGVGKTAQSAGQDTARKLLTAVPNPAQMVYSLGLGIGPLIKNIVEASKEKENQKQSKLPADKRPVTQKDQVKSTTAINKQQKLLIQQITLSNKLLKEIKTIQAKQLHSINRQTLMELGETSMINLNIGKGKKKGQLSRGELSADGGVQPQTKLSSMEFPAEAKVAVMGVLGALIAKELWGALPEEIKDELAKTATSIGEVVANAVGSAFKWGIENAPLTTIVASALAVKLSGLWSVMKGAYNLGEWMMKPVAAEAAAKAASKPTIEPPPAVPKPAVPQMPTAPAKDIELYRNRGEVGLQRAGYSAEEISKIKAAANYTPPPVTPSMAPAEVTKAGSVAAEAGTATKTVGALTKVASAVGKIVPIVGAGFSALSAAENYKQGNNILATLDAISAATALGGVAATATGFGAPVGAALLATSVVTGLASSIGGLFVGRKPTEGAKTAGAGTQGPPAGSVAVSDKDRRAIQDKLEKAGIKQGSQQEIMKIIEEVFRSRGYSDVQIKAAQIVAAAESGLDPYAMGDGVNSIGLFQLNRAGGEGKGFSVEQLVDPVFNSTVVADRMNGKRGEKFRNAKTVEEAVMELTREFERPSFTRGGQIIDQTAFQEYATRGARVAGRAVNSTALASASNGVTPSSLTSTASTAGGALANQQDDFSRFATALAGQNVNINIANVVQEALREGGSGGGGSNRPAPSTPRDSNPAFDMRHSALGTNTY